MDDPHRELLTTLSTEALEYHEKAKVIYCEGGEWPDLEVWSRTWRKKLEPIYYTCSKKAKPPAPPHTVPVNICVGNTCLRPPAPAPAHQVTPIGVCVACHEPPAPARKSILSGDVILEESREFVSGENAGWKAAERLLKDYEVTEDEFEFADLVSKAHYSPYAPNLPKYLKEDFELHRAYGMGFDYGVANALRENITVDIPPPAKKSPINVCTQIARAKKIHEDYMHIPEDPITGDWPWHSHWINVYDQTLDKMQCGVEPPVPPQPFGWIGGKKQLAKTIVALIPPHKTYVEAFCGAAAVFWKKERSAVEVLNDLDKDLIRFYRHIGDIDRCDIKDISRDWDTLRNKQGKQEPCEFLSNVLCSFGKGRGSKVKDKHINVGHVCFTGATSFHRYLPEYKDRLKGVKLHNEDWEAVVRRYDAKDTFFYLDPPYHNTSRKYNHGSDQLERLASVLPTLKGKWLLTYDDDPDVRRAFAKYHLIKASTQYSIAGTSDKPYGRQVLIANYPIKKPPTPPPSYKFMSLSEISKYEPEMERLKVSEVARSPRGFLTAYKRAGSSSSLSESWRKERDGFIARHLAQYNDNPTYRRQLALIAWAYMPAKNPPAPAPLNICVHCS